MATNWEELVENDDLLKATKERKKDFIEKIFSPEKINSEIENGWERIKDYANGSALLRKKKSISDLFENEVWLTFKNMGFKIMNATNKFELSYSDSSQKQIDVIAIDDEICLLIECKAATKEEKDINFKKELESINGNLSGLQKEIRKRFKNIRVKYIFATKDYIVGEADLNRMNDFNIAYFDYEKIRYYNDLSAHLGSAARYQLLGDLFAKKDIKGMDFDIPAIEGKMGAMKYYTFLIEPERLLKLAYILHRTKANHTLMPTYQRLIKKDRLKAIREFVNSGGYFPNSLIVSIDTNGKSLVFNQLSTKQDNQARLGILKLPKTYQSLYVIDGQHRLYGYSDSKYALKDCIPVVAFVDMDKQTQVKLFMDINENQKAVPKSLRNTLNIDLLWDSKLFTDRLEALRLFCGQQLGEDPKSPLFGRVNTGEDLSNNKRCITLDFINSAFKQSDFFNSYKKGKNEVIKNGTFDMRNNDETAKKFLPFLYKCFKTIKDYCSDEWEKGNEGFLTINNTTFALIKIFNDIVNIQLKNTNSQIVDDADAFFLNCENMLLELADTISSSDLEIKKDIKDAKGEGAKKLSWNKLRVAFHKKYPAFIYPELEEYIQENCSNNNPDAKDYLSKILLEIKKRLKEKMGDNNWMYDYLPEKLREDLISRAAIENDKRKHNGNSVMAEEWDFISFNEIRQIANHEKNWSDFCREVLFLKTSTPNKTDTLVWLSDLEKYKNAIDRDQAILTSEFKKIVSIYNELLNQNESD